MTDYKTYIANTLVGKRVRFVCDCVVRLDVTGDVTGHEIHGNEIVYLVYVPEKNKTMKIGENTPKLSISIL